MHAALGHSVHRGVFRGRTHVIVRYFHWQVVDARLHFGGSFLGFVVCQLNTKKCFRRYPRNSSRVIKAIFIVGCDIQGQGSQLFEWHDESNTGNTNNGGDNNGGDNSGMQLAVVDGPLRDPRPQAAQHQQQPHSAAPHFRVVSPQEEPPTDTPASLQSECGRWVVIGGIGGASLRRSPEETQDYLNRVSECMTRWDRDHRDDTVECNKIRELYRRLQGMFENARQGRNDLF